jgi:hypothetical protein
MDQDGGGGGSEGTMEAAEVIEALKGLPGIRAAVMAGRVSAYVPAIDDAVRIDAAEVRRYRRIWAPNGDPAVEFVLGDEREARPLIVTPSDVVYHPVDTRTVLDSLVEHRITNAPHIVAYTEMEHASEEVALTWGHFPSRAVPDRRGHAGWAAAGTQCGMVAEGLDRYRR